jgi:hypothetical protein
MKTIKIYLLSAGLLLAGFSVASAKQTLMEKAAAKAKAKKDAKQQSKQQAAAAKAAGSTGKTTTGKAGIAVKKQGAPSTGASGAASATDAK